MAFGSFAQYGNAWNNLMTFQDGRLLTWIWNSVWYTAMIVPFSCATAILAGYALATAPLPFRRSLLITTLIAMIVPPVALVLPIFIEITALRIYDSPWAIILTSSFYPFGVFLAYIYFSTSIPKELYEAARIDGAGEFGTFWRVALPLSKGLLGMLAFFSFTATWVNYFLPYVMVNSGELLTLPVGLGVLFSATPALNPGIGASILPIRQPEIALAGLHRRDPDPDRLHRVLEAAGPRSARRVGEELAIRPESSRSTWARPPAGRASSPTARRASSSGPGAPGSGSYQGAERAIERSRECSRMSIPAVSQGAGDRDRGGRRRRRRRRHPAPRRIRARAVGMGCRDHERRGHRAHRRVRRRTGHDPDRGHRRGGGSRGPGRHLDPLRRVGPVARR